ncbi:MAG: gluconate:H+ symporter [Sediminibacterium sp.]|jgi:Gnt-I system high-affinity gluconate transporter
MQIFLVLLLVIIGLTVLTSVCKISPFISFLIIAIGAGLLFGMPLLSIAKSLQKGIGDMLGSIIVTLASGAMIGKLVAKSGAANVIAEKVITICGRKYLSWGMMLTGLIIGIPLFYNVGFVLVIPIIFSLVYQYKLPVIQVAIPILAALSVAHSLLPPHPSPAALIGIFNASISKTFFYGMIAAIPAVVLAGPVFSRFLSRIKPISTQLYAQETTQVENPPSLGISILSALMPIFLLLITILISIIFKGNTTVEKMYDFIHEPSILMLVSLLIVTLLLGKRQGMSIQHVMTTYDQGIREIATIILIIGASGGLKQILIDSQVSNEIALALQAIQIHPLILAWLVAATIRLLLGSATVAGLTAAGIIAPVISDLNVDPNLIILAIGSGSIFCSHVNDTGFWMFKEYFNVSVKDTFLSWSLMETIVSVVGLIGVLVLSLFV